MRRENVVNQIREMAHRFIPDAQTILYGSEARGDARSDSDVDLLILLPSDAVSPEVEHSIVGKLYEIELQSGVIISSLILPKDKWEHPDVVTPFHINVRREGVRL